MRRGIIPNILLAPSYLVELVLVAVAIVIVFGYLYSFRIVDWLIERRSRVSA